MRRGRMYSGSRLNGTHRTVREVGEHLPSRRSQWDKPARKEQLRVVVGYQLLSQSLIELAVI